MILIIDAAHQPIRIGLAEAGKPLAVTELAERRELSRRLLQIIEDVLQAAQIEVGQLEAIAAVRGPGPFTSLRISLAVANALAAGSARPLVGLGPAESWDLLVKTATSHLTAGDVARQLLPEYGRPPSISRPVVR